MIELAARGISVGFDPDCGMLRGLTVQDEGRTHIPMHLVPWIGEDMPKDTPRHLARMEGDFFCAPFADGGGTAPVLHGWPANGRWHLTTISPSKVSATLDQLVQGATLTTEIRVIDGHPFVYRTHRFRGGAGLISAANHAMVSLPSGGIISLSGKSHFETPNDPQERDPMRGRSLLAYPARSADPASFSTSSGQSVDLTQYPWGPQHEDFVVGIEAPGHPIGWTAVVRRGEGNAYLSLRDATDLPMTMLWHSNRGRDFAPWSGRHANCLGVEEGFAPHMLGQSGGYDLGADEGLDLRHVTGVISWPSEERITNVLIRGRDVSVEGESGATRTVPIDPSALASHAALV